MRTLSKLIGVQANRKEFRGYEDFKPKKTGYYCCHMWAVVGVAVWIFVVKGGMA